MMSEHNVVIVKEAQNLKELNKSAGSDEEGSSSKQGSVAIQQFIHYLLAHPQPTTILVICFKYKTIDKRSAVARLSRKRHFESKNCMTIRYPTGSALT